MQQYLEAGRITNTHGLRGEVRIEPWCDSPEWFCALKRIRLDGKTLAVRSAKVHGNLVIALLEGVDSVDAAIPLKNKTIYIDRDDVRLEPGACFVQDLIGLKALDADTGAELGVIREVTELPAGRMYEIQGEREILVPDRPEFVVERNPAGGYVRFRLIEGM